ncbi:MAG: hypothetical protein CM15mP118_1710 [Alphaproteobacteria bacterium]|nr:MAG: hypothetical protein CM15mP118_1710 [Alphaproteobacteria bacterium]
MIINSQHVERQLREEKMEIRKNWIPVKLKAVDDQDLQVFSQFLFESIVLPSEINFEEKKQRFAMAIERFTWEHAKNESHLLMQVLSILVINYVEKVDLKNISNNYKIKNILSISNIDNNILIMLNDNEVITLKVKKCFCLLEDIGKPIYPAIIPAYSKNDL